MWRASDFWGDDLTNFLLLKQLGLREFLLAPIDVHRTPGHRLLTWLVFELAPMSFLGPVAVMLALHAGTLFYLHRSLRLAGAGGSGDAVLCCYAASPLIVFGMLWWAHAQHRMPYVLLDAFAIYHYLAWARGGASRHLAAFGTAIALGFAFYEKAALIPLHALAFAACAAPTELRARPLRFAGPALLAGAACAALSLGLAARTAGPPLSLDFVVATELAFLKMLASGALGVLLAPEYSGGSFDPNVRLAWVVALWGSLVGFSVWRARETALLWLALLAVLAVDYLPLALSDRVVVFGPVITRQYRFHYEELHLVVLFLGLICARAFRAPTQAGTKRVRVLGLAVAAAFVVLTPASLWLQEERSSTLGVHRRARLYLRNVRAGLAAIEEAEPRFRNGPLPPTLSGFSGGSDTRALIHLFEPRARFTPGEGPVYEVWFDGQVVRRSTETP